MEYYSAVKRSELLINAIIWGRLRGLVQSERSQCQRLHAVWSCFYVILRTARLQAEHRLAFARVEVGRGFDAKEVAHTMVLGDDTAVCPAFSHTSLYLCEHL